MRSFLPIDSAFGVACACISRINNIIKTSICAMLTIISYDKMDYIYHIQQSN